jgi:hypothetical protein
LTEIPSGSPSKTRNTAVFLIFIAFIAGLFVGISADRFYLLRTRQWFPHHGSEFAAQRLVERLDYQLRLSPAQKTEVQRIVERHRDRIENIMNGVRPQLHQEIETASAEIEKVLTQEQREKFRTMPIRLHGPRLGRERHDER